MASDDDDESLAQFLESEVLSAMSDQEDEKREGGIEEENEDGDANTMLFVEDDFIDEAEEVEMRKEEEENEDAEDKEINKMLIEDGGTSCDDEDKEQEQGEERKAKRKKIEEVDSSINRQPMMLKACNMLSSTESASLSPKVTETDEGKGGKGNSSDKGRKRLETGNLSKVPPELFRNILKFLSSEDLVSCSLACRFLNLAASDESLWRSLYSMRWGLLPPKKLRECAWKKLYIQRDEEDMVELVRSCPPEFKEYYIQMQAAKRSQAPLASQVLDDRVSIDKTVTDQVSSWKSSRGLGDKVVADHACSGDKCSYFNIGDAFVCEKTGNVHVCGDTCKEAVADPVNELLVCTISGRCFDRLLSPDEIESEVRKYNSFA
ncbi:OLC1v1030827C2 [Oldenlandia corymbosa var. corymbosa]|uniref:OLC1v1030827C2 n=1 Tax=Oldenlandia corymbosa var. corymbosa TaxID=529605 RepID=A0AAV1CIY0_OLDCO|nr:OLC1v1030827C2 [Oldenlandia corymbosa var. corymbosa]